MKLKRHEIDRETAQEMFDYFYHEEHFFRSYRVEDPDGRIGTYGGCCVECKCHAGKEANAVYRMEQILHRKFISEDELRELLRAHARKRGLREWLWADLLHPTVKRPVKIPAIFRNQAWGVHRYRGWYCLRDVIQHLRPFKKQALRNRGSERSREYV